MKKLKLNINCHYGCFGSFSERYVPGGYDKLYDFEKMLEDMAKIDGLERFSCMVSRPSLHRGSCKIKGGTFKLWFEGV